MKIYKISCTSECGTYFAAYLQSVTVVAESEGDAIEVFKKWSKEDGMQFTNKDESKWSVNLLLEVEGSGAVVDWHEDSDY